MTRAQLNSAPMGAGDVLKIEHWQDMAKVSHFKALSFILVKLTVPYLAASPKNIIPADTPFTVLQISREDWNLVRLHSGQNG